MNWSDLGKRIAGLGLPLLGGAVAGPGGAALGTILSNALDLQEDTPDAIAGALQSNPDAAIRLKEIQLQHVERLEELTLQRAQAEAERDAREQGEINTTMRAELVAPSGYRAGWRPLFGYVAAFGIGGLLAALVFAMFKDPKSAADLIESATILLTMVLAVLGVNIRSRSQDKQTPFPNRPLGLVEAFAQRIAK